MGLDKDPNPTVEHRFEAVGLKHLMRRSQRRRQPMAQQQDAITEMAGEMQVMGDDHNRLFPRELQAVQDPEAGDLVMDIKIGRRFVQNQHRCPLRQGSGEIGPLSFPGRY